MKANEAGARFDAIDRQLESVDKRLSMLHTIIEGNDDKVADVVKKYSNAMDSLVEFAVQVRDMKQCLLANEQWQGKIPEMVGGLEKINQSITTLSNQFMLNLPEMPMGKEPDIAPDTQPDPINKIIKAPGVRVREKAIQWIGLHERENRTEIQNRFVECGIYMPERIKVDPVVTSWCALVLCAWIIQAGYKIETLYRANAFKDLYRVVGEAKVGDIAVLEGHVALVVGFAPVGKKITDAADIDQLLFVEPRSEKDVVWVIGGNQSNEVNASPLEWYTQTKDFLGFRRMDADNIKVTDLDIDFEQFVKKAA